MVDLNELDLQWRKHPFEDGLSPTLTWEEYWLKVKSAKFPSGDPKYPQLITFLGLMASFPFSNVVVERLLASLSKSNQIAEIVFHANHWFLFCKANLE